MRLIDLVERIDDTTVINVYRRCNDGELDLVVAYAEESLPTEYSNSRVKNIEAGKYEIDIEIE